MRIQSKDRIVFFAYICAFSSFICNAGFVKQGKVSIGTGPFEVNAKGPSKDDLDKKIRELADTYEANPASINFESSAQELIDLYSAIYNPQFGSWFSSRQKQIDILNKIIELYKDKKDALDSVVRKFQNISEEWTTDFTKKNMNVAK